MASVPPRFRAELARLAHLPRRAGLTLLGSLRPLDCRLFAPGQTIQPWLALWIDEHSRAIRGAQLFNPQASTSSGHSEALGALIHALGASVIPPTSPRVPQANRDAGVAWPRPGLPERVYADDHLLATIAGDLLRPLHIPVEFRPALPVVDSFFTSLTGFLASTEPGTEPTQPSVPPAPHTRFRILKSEHDGGAERDRP